MDLSSTCQTTAITQTRELSCLTHQKKLTSQVIYLYAKHRITTHNLRAPGLLLRNFKPPTILIPLKQNPKKNKTRPKLLNKLIPKGLKVRPK